MRAQKPTVTNMNKDPSSPLKMLQWVAVLFCASDSKSKLPTMAIDPALQLINHDLSYDTNEFLSCLINLAISSPDYNAVLKRFLVLSMTLTKTVTSPQHELLALEIMDTVNNGSPPYLMFLERTKSEKLLNTEAFLKHPDSTTVLEGIIDSLKQLPSTLLSSIPAMSDSEDESSSKTHSPPDSPHISPSDPLLGSSSTSSPSLSNQSNKTLFRNLVDSGALVSIKGVQASAESTRKFKLAGA
jgi:hypothetical protein